MPDRPYVRRSARVLLLDAADRLLLLCFYKHPHRPDLGYCWVTPGGGINDGEPLREAAARELHEEVGLAVAPAALGSVVAVTSGYADLGSVAGVFRDDYFFHRVTAHEVDASGQEDWERSQLTAHRWWTIAELASTTETVYPFGLVGLLTDLAAGRLPGEPV